MMRSVDQLSGSSLQARDGEIGSVREAYFDDESWTIRYLVVDTGQWLSGREVLISPRSVVQPVGGGKIVEVSLTREQVKNSPHIDTHKPVSRQHEQQQLEYYGFLPYWGGPGMMAMGTSPLFPIAPRSEIEREPIGREDEVPSGDEHLRSTAKVAGYDIQATDDSIGHVEDFLFDDESWAIRYLVVDTRNWWPGGKKVLLAVRSIERIDWSGSKVYVKLTRDAVKNSPDYKAGDSERDYEARLYDASRNDGHWS